MNTRAFKLIWAALTIAMWVAASWALAAITGWPWPFCAILGLTVIAAQWAIGFGLALVIAKRPAIRNFSRRWLGQDSSDEADGFSQITQVLKPRQ